MTQEQAIAGGQPPYKYIQYPSDPGIPIKQVADFARRLRDEGKQPGGMVREPIGYVKGDDDLIPRPIMGDWKPAAQSCTCVENCDGRNRTEGTTCRL